MIDCTVVVDVGSRITRIGLAGENEPRLEYRSLFGTPKYPKEEKVIIYGDEASKKRGILKCSYPIVDGVINIENMIKIIDYGLESINMKTSVKNLVLTSSAIFDDRIKNDIAKQLFEYFELERLYIPYQAQMSLIAEGYSNGIVIDIGHQGTYVTPIIDGKPFSIGMFKTPIGMKKIVPFTSSLLHFSRELFSTEFDFFEYIVFSCCHFAESYDEEIKKSSDSLSKTYCDPNSICITLCHETYMALELLFKPELDNLEAKGLGTILNECYQVLKDNNQLNGIDRIVVSGSLSSFNGIVQRLMNETKGYGFEVNKTKSPTLSAWIGGSIIGSKLIYHHLFTTRSHFIETGSLIKD